MGYCIFFGIERSDGLCGAFESFVVAVYNYLRCHRCNGLVNSACAKGVAYAEKVQAESPVVDRWNDYMKDILELEMDPVTGAQPKLEQVFRLD